MLTRALVAVIASAWIIHALPCAASADTVAVLETQAKRDRQVNSDAKSRLAQAAAIVEKSNSEFYRIKDSAIKAAQKSGQLARAVQMAEDESTRHNNKGPYNFLGREYSLSELKAEFSKAMNSYTQAEADVDVALKEAKRAYGVLGELSKETTQANALAKKSQTDAEIERMMLAKSGSDESGVVSSEVEAVVESIKSDRMSDIAQLAKDRLRGKIDNEVYKKRVAELINESRDVSEAIRRRPQSEQDAELSAGNGLNKRTRDLESALLLSSQDLIARISKDEASAKDLEFQKVVRRLRQLKRDIKASRQSREREATSVCQADNPSSSIAQLSAVALAVEKSEGRDTDELQSLNDLSKWLKNPIRHPSNASLSSSYQSTLDLLLAYTEERSKDLPAYQRTLASSQSKKAESCLTRSESPLETERTTSSNIVIAAGGYSPAQNGGAVASYYQTMTNGSDLLDGDPSAGAGGNSSRASLSH